MADAGGEVEPKETTPSLAAPLNTLLDRLAMGDEAAPAYEYLRMRLITFFRLRYPVEAEALADEAIDRLARRLNEGTPVDNLAAYALGIARFLALETGARHRKESHAAREAMLEVELDLGEAEPGPALPALRACLKALGAESARFIVDYYAVDGGASRIERRRQLAERFGLTLNALRNRALRTRIALEKCVRARLEAASTRRGGDIPPKALTKGMIRHQLHDDTYD